MCEFISNYASQIWTILSVCVGGGMTYFTSSRLENKKYKRQLQKEKLDTVLIPFCKCLKSTCKQIEDYNKGLIDNHQIFNCLKDPLQYLEISREIYLSKTIQNRLKIYKSTLDRLTTTLYDEIYSYRIEYNNYISKILSNLTNIGIFKTDQIQPILEDSALDWIAYSILSKKYKYITPLLTSIFYFDDIENDILNKEIILKMDGQIIHTDNPAFSDNNALQATIIWDYLQNNKNDEDKTFSHIINSTKSNALLYDLNQQLNELEKLQTAEIHKIAP